MKYQHNLIVLFLALALGCLLASACNPLECYTSCLLKRGGTGFCIQVAGKPDMCYCTVGGLMNSINFGMWSKHNEGVSVEESSLLLHGIKIKCTQRFK